MAMIGQGTCAEYIFLDNLPIDLPDASFTMETTGDYLIKYSFMHLFVKCDPLVIPTPTPSGTVDLYVNDMLVHSLSETSFINTEIPGVARLEGTESFATFLEIGDKVTLRAQINTGIDSVIEKKISNAKFIILEP